MKSFVSPNPGEGRVWHFQSDATLRILLLKEDKLKLGDWAEELTANLVRARGGKIVSRNAFYGKLEIDCLAILDGELVAIETRCRRKNSLQDAESSVGRIKLERLYRGIQLAAEQLNWKGNYRVDLVTVDVEMSGGVAHWIEGLEG